MADIHTLKQSITEMSQDEAEALVHIHRNARIVPMEQGKSRQSKKRKAVAKKKITSKPVKRDMSSLLKAFGGDKEALIKYLTEE